MASQNDWHETGWSLARIGDKLSVGSTTVWNRSGIHLKDCHVEDRGDGAMVLVPPEFPKTWLVDQLPGRLLAGLREHNAVHTTESQIGMRVALHAGEWD